MSQSALIVIVALFLPLFGDSQNNDFEALSPDAQHYIQGFKEYSADMLRLQPEIADVPAFGSFSFGVSHILGLINEQKWKLKTDGIHRALRVPDKRNLTEAVGTLLKLFYKDPHTCSKYQSVLYTPRRGGENYPGLQVPEELDTSVWTVEDYAWENSRNYINGEIKRQTLGKLEADFIPRGGWFGPNIIMNYTRALYTNTFFSEYKWDVELQKYKNETFSKYSGPLRSAENTMFSAYSIPLKPTLDPILTGTFQSIRDANAPPRRSIVLVQPKISTKDFLMKGITPLFSLNSSDWRKLSGVIRIPFVNHSLVASTEKQLEKTGITKTFCNVAPEEQYFAQRIAQHMNIYLGSEAVRFVSATGVVVSNYKEFAEYHHISSSTDIKSATNEPPEIHAKQTKSNKATHSPSIAQNLSTEITIRTPFLAYLNDEELGPIFLGMVNSLEKSEKLEDDFGINIGDIINYSKWSCK